MIVAVKRRLGQSGSSANTSGGYAAASPELDPEDSAWQHYADTIAGGGWVNERHLVRAVTAWLRTAVYHGGRMSTRPIERDPDEETRIQAKPAAPASPKDFVE